MIAPLVAEALPKIRALCKRQGVERMSLFGSAVSDHFSPETSDIDFIVKFSDSNKPGIADRYWDLAESLEQILRRPVDLLTERSIRSPFFRKTVENSKISIYDRSTA